MLVEYHKSSQELRETKRVNIIAFLVNQWALNNGLLCGQSFNPASLASYLGCGIDDINDIMKERLLNNRIWDKENQEKLLNAITGMSISMAMEDRMEAASQVEILKRSQGDHYVPFISSELRMSLDLKMKAGANLSSLIKNIMGGTTNVFNINAASDTTHQTNDFLTKEDALKILQSEQQSLSDNQKNAKFLEDNYDMSGLPAVCARDQTVDASKEGLDILKVELTQITDDYKLHRDKPLDVDFHELRRGLEMDIEEDTDPEMDNY